MNTPFWLGLLAIAVGTTGAAAQDTTVVERGVRIGITYEPGVRPGMLVLGGERGSALDSARTIIARDLDYSDEFEMIALPLGDSLSLRIRPAEEDQGTTSFVPFVNYGLYAALGADFAVNVSPETDSSVVVTLYDVPGETVRRELRIPPLNPAARGFRLRVHRIADEIVRAVTGVPGVAATQILFINAGRIYRVDFDGHTVEGLSTPGLVAMSPAWHPEGHQAVFTEFLENGQGPLYVLDLDTGRRSVIEVTVENGLNYTPSISPDGRTLAFSRVDGEGTDIYTYNLADDCCLQRLTVGGFSDNLSPTFSPDGQRIAYVSTRPGYTQIYIMGSDGTGQELFAPFAYGVSGESHAPEWSPDGLNIAFDRYVSKVSQIFVMDVGNRVVRQLTSLGRNSDPTWAPDGRHLAFVSSRTGSKQVWIIDIETGRVRQLTRLGEARLPAWSPRIAERTNQ
jgi:TolB protein